MVLTPPKIDLVAVLRECAPQVLARVYRRFGDFSEAEDAVQEALLAAASQWPTEGLPENPRAWLTTVATRHSIDHIRSQMARRRREAEYVRDLDVEGAPPDQEAEGDEVLSMIFLCCHSALSAGSSIALTLRAVGGLTTAEVARAYLVPEATMAQRISRAKQTIREAGLGFDRPQTGDWEGRLVPVLRVLYLMYNEGYVSSSGPDLTRDDLSVEAIRLTRLLHVLLPQAPEVTGLLALLLLTQARRPARTTTAGDLVPLDRQDRGLWDRTLIEEGLPLVSQALGQGAAGPYQIQAAIAALHDEAPTFAQTDWPQILGLYTLLGQMDDNPLVALNQTIALAMVHGPARGLAHLDQVAADPRLAGHPRVPSTRAHLLERLGRLQEAAAAYHEAAQRTTSPAEREYLLLQAAQVIEGSRVEKSGSAPTSPA